MIWKALVVGQMTNAVVMGLAIDNGKRNDRDATHGHNMHTVREDCSGPAIDSSRKGP